MDNEGLGIANTQEKTYIALGSMHVDMYLTTKLYHMLTTSIIFHHIQVHACHHFMPLLRSLQLILTYLSRNMSVQSQCHSEAYISTSGEKMECLASEGVSQRGGPKKLVRTILHPLKCRRLTEGRSLPCKVPVYRNHFKNVKSLPKRRSRAIPTHPTPPLNKNKNSHPPGYGTTQIRTQPKGKNQYQRARPQDVLGNTRFSRAIRDNRPATRRPECCLVLIGGSWMGKYL